MQGIKRAGSAALGLALAFSLFGGVHAALAAPPAPPSPPAVYNAIPSPLPPNVASLGFQATQTSEFGDYVHLGGTNRVLNTVTVTMSDWALFSDYSNDPRYEDNSVTWTHPITVKVYKNSVNPTTGVPDTLLATKTENISIPWRPAADSTCPLVYGVHGWRASDELCYNGFAFNAVFDLSSPGVVLPDDVIVGIAFNTQSYGAVPEDKVGPYNSLNVGIPGGQTATVGSDDNADNVYWDSTYPGYTAGFREDSGWTPNGTVAMKITASPARNQCKQSGWMNFNDPSFKNQGDCVSFVATGGKNTTNG